MSGGSRVIRKCICEKYAAGSLEIRAPQPFRPVCPPREKFVAGRAPGNIPSDVHRAGFHRSAQGCGVGRGAARTILAYGGSFAPLLRAGQWCASSCHPNLDMGMEEGTSMANGLIEASDDKGSGRGGQSEKDSQVPERS